MKKQIKKAIWKFDKFNTLRSVKKVIEVNSLKNGHRMVADFSFGSI